MKIGILTYHRPYNYGATLQAIALRQYLISKDNEVYYVDYFPDYHRDMYKIFDIKRLVSFNIFKSVDYVLKTILTYSLRKERINHYIPFITSYIEPYCKQDTESSLYDLIIYGSDQIWRKQPTLGNFNPVYFGKVNSRTARKISYAASMGTINLNEGDKLFLQESLMDFNAIGVRESSLKDVLNSIGIPAIHNLDPTFLLSSSQWDTILKTERLIEGEYAFYYKVSPGFNDNSIIEYCKEKRIKLVSVYSLANYKHSDYNPNPSEFVSLIKYASFVFTTSFHGLAFSLIYRKQFLSSCQTKSERLTSLLSSLNLEQRFVTSKNCINLGLSNKIDYDIVGPKIEILIDKSRKFLTDNM